MKRASLIGLISSLGALLGSGCGSEPPVTPVDDSLFVDRPSVPLTTTAAGYAWDPEAFFLSVSACNTVFGGACPIPPLLGDGVPLFAMASVQNASVLVMDPLDPEPKHFAQPTGPNGLWRIEGLPSRDEVPFFIANAGGGVLPTLPPEATAGLPPVAAATYLPTATLRPFFTGGSYFCPVGESIHTGNTGVLEAVAKYRTSKGKNTNVVDFINPTRFDAVTVFWLYAPAPLPTLLFPADKTTVQSAVGEKYHIDWAAPGTKGTTQSSRGFYVEDKAFSSIGVTVVVLPAGTITDPTAPVEYLPVDTLVDAAQGRPFQFMPLPFPAIPGMISATSLQLFSGAPPPDPEDVPNTPIPPFLCLF